MPTSRNSLYNKYFCRLPASENNPPSQRYSQPQKLNVTNASSESREKLRMPMERLIIIQILPQPGYQRPVPSVGFAAWLCRHLSVQMFSSPFHCPEGRKS